MFTMYNVYRRISKKNFNGSEVVSRKTRINNYEIDTYTVGQWFKNFARNLADAYDVRAMSTTAFRVEVSVLTKDGENLIFEYWAESTK